MKFQMLWAIATFMAAIILWFILNHPTLLWVITTKNYRMFQLFWPMSTFMIVAIFSCILNHPTLLLIILTRNYWIFRASQRSWDSSVRFGPSIKKIVLKSLSEKNIARVTVMSPVYRKNHNYECVRRTREA